MYFDHSTQFAGNIYCEALTTDTQAMAVCAGESGTGQTETNGEYTLYLLSGNGTGSFEPVPPQHTSGVNSICDAASLPHVYSCDTYTYSDGTIMEIFSSTGTSVSMKITDPNGNVTREEYCEHTGSSCNLTFAVFCQKYPGIETVGRHNCSE